MRSKARIGGLLAAAQLALFAVVWGIDVIRSGYSARTEPSLVETFIARNLRSIAIPSEAKKAENPYLSSAEKLTRAEEHWVEHCSMCHGLDGSGDSLIGRNLYPKPPDLRADHTQQLTDGELYYIINNGVRFTGMPAWGGVDDPEQIWRLVAFIRRLPSWTLSDLELIRRRHDLTSSSPGDSDDHNHSQ